MSSSVHFGALLNTPVAAVFGPKVLELNGRDLCASKPAVVRVGSRGRASGVV